MTDDSIERAIAQGQANQANFRLVENWCAHIKITRFGGIGMIEQQFGVPIGHFGPACDHAGAAGVMSSDIRDAAVDFYDRYCSTCTLRKLVRKPDLSQWVAERDAEAAATEAEQAAAAAKAAKALGARRDARLELRQGLSPAAADVVDQLAELDEIGTADLAERLVATARLAPEAFPAPVREHLFTLLETEQSWAEVAALEILSVLGADPPRLARAAAASLRRGSQSHSPIRAFVRSLSSAGPEDVESAFPAFVELADPHRQPFRQAQKARRAPLVRLARAFPAQVKDLIDVLLSKGDPVSISIAARGASTLIRWAPSTVTGFARSMVSALVRAKWIPDRRALERDASTGPARDLSDAVVDLFQWNPVVVDDLLQKFRAGASPDGEARIYAVYHAVLRGRTFRREGVTGPPERLAFGRLFREAPRTSNWDILDEINQGIDDRPERFAALADEHRDELLGTAIMMDERLIAFDAEPEGKNLLEQLERRNRRDSLRRLRDKFVAWAAVGAAANEDFAAYTKVLENLPEVRDGFAACMTEKAVGLATTTRGLNAVLPALYTGLVGASVARRGAAAAAVEKIPSHLRRHAPDLLFEAFIPALTDPYVYVHRSALHALRGMRLPEAFDTRVREAVSALVLSYGRTGEDYTVLLEGIEILAGRHLTEDELAGRPGAYLVSVLAKLPLWSLNSHIEFLARKLGRAGGLVELLIRMLQDPQASEHTFESVLDALAGVPNDVVHAHREAIAAIAAGPTWETRRVVHALAELLTRAGAWAEAVQIAEQAVAEIPDTRRERPQRRLMDLLAASARYEFALASGDHDGANAAASRWRDIRAEMKRDADAA